MKILCLFLSLLLVFSFIVSCDKVEDTPEVTTTTVATTTVATTTVATTTALPEPTDGITIGTTKKEVRKRFSNTMTSIWNGDAVYFFGSYGFFRDSNGYNVMLEFDDEEEEKVISIERIPMPIVTEEILNSLPDKISLQSAFEILGRPGYLGSGHIAYYLEYTYEDGSLTKLSIGGNRTDGYFVYVRNAPYKWNER